jgi:hypothetical protein
MESITRRRFHAGMLPSLCYIPAKEHHKTQAGSGSSIGLSCRSAAKPSQGCDLFTSLRAPHLTIRQSAHPPTHACRVVCGKPAAGSAVLTMPAHHMPPDTHRKTASSQLGRESYHPAFSSIMVPLQLSQCCCKRLLHTHTQLTGLLTVSLAQSCTHTHTHQHPHPRHTASIHWHICCATPYG